MNRRLGRAFAGLIVVGLVVAAPACGDDGGDDRLSQSEFLEQANQISTSTTYGSAVPAALLFSLLTVLDRVVPGLFGWLERGAVDVALYLNGLSFIVSGIVIAGLAGIPRGPADSHGEGNLVAAIVHGWK